MNQSNQEWFVGVMMKFFDMNVLMCMKSSIRMVMPMINDLNPKTDAV
jgi:hypothetical protein